MVPKLGRKSILSIDPIKILLFIESGQKGTGIDATMVLYLWPNKRSWLLERLGTEFGNWNWIRGDFGQLIVGDVRDADGALDNTSNLYPG